MTLIGPATFDDKDQDLTRTWASVESITRAFSEYLTMARNFDIEPIPAYEAWICQEDAVDYDFDNPDFLWTWGVDAGTIWVDVVRLT